MRDFPGFISCVTDVLKPQLDVLGFNFKDAGLLPTSNFIEIPGTHWFYLVLWVEKRADGTIFEISQRCGGDIGDTTSKEDVEELCSRILQKIKETMTLH